MIGAPVCWCNMAKDYAKAFYNSKEWKNARQSYISYRISVDGGLCEKCHKRLGYIVHHKINLNPMNIYDPNISLNRDNLMYECKSCHDREENHYIGNGEIVSAVCAFDSNGNPFSLRECDQ